ncbi:MAG: ATP-dependent Clp protease ATP-binding subunit [Ruminococcaceae bacterium]|nr:ATP-dependent Clp protease ATP-binding subunit [Oscillospiraceae bacterium]
MKLCSKCKKRPAVVFLSDASNPNAEPNGLCLVCAKELGIKPVDDMLKKMNITDEDIEQMSSQFMELMSPDMSDEDSALNDETFDLGTAPAFPFLSNLFGGMGGSKSEKSDDEDNEKDAKKGDEKKKKKKRRYLDQFCTNLTQRAKEGKLDAIIGRDKELYRTIQILSRRTKNNPCLIGEPGVGKTAIAEGLALRIASGEAPVRLLDKEIMLLDLTGLVAGTQFRGQFEARVKGLIEEVKSAGNIILFIDEIHNLVGAGDSAEGSMNAANILKPALSRGEIQVIGATTFKEYRKYIEKDAALERRFQPVTIEEPSIAETQEVLLGVKGYYEGYHNVTISDEIVRKVVLLSERYVTDRFLPDKAIDLLDEACACASLENKAMDELYIANKRIAENSVILEELEAQVDNPDYEKQALIKAEIEKYKMTVDRLCGPASEKCVTERDVAKVIELWTGVPAEKVEESELKKLSDLEEILNQKVIGQGEATKLVAAAVKRSRVKTGTQRRPASFIFVGPTGVGKTHLVKSLSEQLFSTPETLIRLDMSEFMEKHSVSRLIGAPPGYVGYDEAGQLTEKVRRKPYSVVLFDEIEKAHPDVLNILLQILDDGRVTDAQGRNVNFENTIIVMTSNAGSDRTDNLMGFAKTQESAAKDKAMKALREFLRPEFIARVDEVVVFMPLDTESLSKIAALMLEEFKEALLEKLIKFQYDAKVCDYIAAKCDGTKTGARELRNIIRREIEDKVVDLIIDSSEGSIGIVKASVKKDGSKIEITAK